MVKSEKEMNEPKEVLRNETQIYLSPTDRFRALFGKTIHCNVTIEIGKDYQPLRTKSSVWVERVFRRKEKGFIHQS